MEAKQGGSISLLPGPPILFAGDRTIICPRDALPGLALHLRQTLTWQVGQMWRLCQEQISKPEVMTND